MNFDSTTELDSVKNGNLYSNNICMKHYTVLSTSALPRNAALRADRLPSFSTHRGVINKKYPLEISNVGLRFLQL